MPWRQHGISGFILVAVSVGAQAQQTGDWRTDPYTKGKPEALRRAGYATLAPEGWREEVERELPSTRIRWVETAHFVIGSSLQSMPMPKASKTRRRLSKELQQLRRKLPTAKPRPRTIDPWLRLHLYAHRCEEIYGQVQFVLRVLDKDFPKSRREAKPPSSSDFMGFGPHLGMRAKYRLLLLQSRDDLARYRSLKQGNTGGSITTPFHHMELAADSLMYCSSLAHYSEQRDPSHALHCQVRFDITQNLLKGYRHYDFVLPAWLMEGVANGILREFDPSQFTYSGLKVEVVKSARNTNWEGTSRKLVKNGFAPKAAQLCTRQNPHEFALHDQVGAWSRVQFLRKRDEGRQFAEFLRLMKAPHPATGKAVPFADVLARQEKAFEKAFAMKWSQFDAAWEKFVQKNYRR